MYFLYNIFVLVFGFLLIPISFFNKKIKLFLNGRKDTFQQLSVLKKTDRVVWFHCASLGEFEQGRPIIETFKIENPTFKIVLTFFSPSGYEIRQNYEFADVICYLPLDTKKNVNRFLDLVHPEISIFVKYEFWPNILKELKNRNINTLLVSAIFRKSQVFFKSNSFAKNFMRNSLKAFNHFFVQDINSEKLLNTIGFNNVTVSGDTRFDSVSNISKQDYTLDFMEKFLKNDTNFVLVAGSTWHQDEEIIINYINKYATTEQQFIIAPHNIKPTEIKKLKNKINKKTILYSEFHLHKQEEQVLILDTIGLLSKIYKHATIAYIGGGFGNGIHNILEAATYGVPILIGPKYDKFKEAVELIDKKGCFVINNEKDFIDNILFLKNPKLLKNTSEITLNYVNDNIGATKCILSYIKKNMTNFTT